MIRRREFLALVSAAGAAAAFPRVAVAQKKVPRVAVASPAVPVAAMVEGGDAYWSAFIQQMTSRGFVEGRTVIYERYYIPSAPQESARAIVGSSPDLIFFEGAAGTAFAALALDKVTPIVAVTGDLLGQGLVASLAQPGGNVTGISFDAGPEQEGKNLQILAEAVPQGHTVAYAISAGGGLRRADSAGAAASRLKLSMVPIIVPATAGDEDLSKAFDAMAMSGAEMIQFGLDVILRTAIPTLARLALAAKLPAISPYVAFVRAGGLLSYGAHFEDVMRRAADYVALILNGAKPGELPVLQPTVYDFGINLKTAKAIGVTLPPSFYVQATEVVE